MRHGNPDAVERQIRVLAVQDDVGRIGLGELQHGEAVTVAIAEDAEDFPYAYFHGARLLRMGGRGWLITANQHHRLTRRDGYIQTPPFEAMACHLAGRPDLREFTRRPIGQRDGQPRGVGGGVEKNDGLPAAQCPAEGADRVGGVDCFE